MALSFSSFRSQRNCCSWGVPLSGGPFDLDGAVATVRDRRADHARDLLAEPAGDLPELLAFGRRERRLRFAEDLRACCDVLR